METEKPFSYEQAKKRLEEISRELEAGRVNIDDLEKVLDEARELIARSLERLTEAEKIIKDWE